MMDELCNGLLSLVSLLATEMIINGGQTCLHSVHQSIGKCFVRVFEEWKVMLAGLAPAHKLVLSDHLALTELLARLNKGDSV